MALLLAMYQKFKLTREKNTLSYKLARHSSKLDRLQNNISKKQKYYEGLLKKAEKKATDFKNMFKLQLQNAYGMGTSVFDPACMNATANTATMMLIAQGLTAGLKDKDGNEVIKQYDDNDAQRIAQALAMGVNNNTTVQVNGETRYGNESLNISAEELRHGSYMQQCAYQQQQKINQYIAAATQQYDTNVSIWYEAYETQIAAEQDSVLGAMEYEESMMELDKVNMETRLERIKAELETYTSLLSEEAKNTAPKFGLG